MVLLSFCLIFYQFQPVVAYKSVAYKKKLVSQPQQSQFPVCNLHSETYSQRIQTTNQGMETFDQAMRRNILFSTFESKDRPQNRGIFNGKGIMLNYGRSQLVVVARDVFRTLLDICDGFFCALP